MVSEDDTASALESTVLLRNGTVVSTLKGL
jgi:hypothetical protein